MYIRVQFKTSFKNKYSKPCYNWIWKPETRDGKLLIDLRLGLKKSGLGDFLNKNEF